MSKVDRIVLVDGTYYEVACAVLADGVTSPVMELLDLLEGGLWKDPSAEEYPDEYQVNHRRRFIAQVKHLANRGELERDYNRLDDGIWEFKIESLRVSFYDTPGDGSYTPKLGEGYDHWRKRHRLPEEFDEFIRVGHYFPKVGQNTSREDIDRTIEVRKEDLSHDKD